MHGYQPSTPADGLLPFVGATADAIDRLTLIAYILDVVYQLLKSSKNECRPDQLGLLLLFNRETLFIFSTKAGLHTRSQKCKHLRDQKLGPYIIVSKVGINPYKLVLPKGCRLHPVFHCD
jgi:hypothetical protein